MEKARNITILILAILALSYGYNEGGAPGSSCGKITWDSEASFGDKMDQVYNARYGRQEQKNC
jgi:hypothetical protein